MIKNYFKFPNVKPQGISCSILYFSIFLFSFIVFLNMDFVPMWDGRVYFDELALAIEQPFNFFNFNIVRHPTMLYMLLIALPQYIDLGNPYLLHGVNLILGILAIYSFHRIIARVFSSDEIFIERSLLTLIFSTYPLFTATSLNLNPDYGVLAFLLLFISVLLERKKIHTLIVGFFLVFSKETGVLLYTATAFLYFYFFVGQSKRSLCEKLRFFIKWGTIMGLPLYTYIIYLIFNFHSNTESVLWQDSGNDFNALINTFTSFSLFNRTFLGYLSGIFIVNFNWIFSLFLLALIASNFFRIVFGLNKSLPLQTEPLLFIFLNYLFVIALYLLTRYLTFVNLRYLLPLFPFLIIVFYYSLLYFVRRSFVRSLVLIITFILLLVSNFKTIDPISKMLYGTFKFGNHSLLNMTKFTGECCGYGRDQIVYNLEYVNLHRVQNEIYRYFKPDSSTVLVSNPSSDWHLIGLLDNDTFERTIRHRNVKNIKYSDPVKIKMLEVKPEVIFYINYPNFDNISDLMLLSTIYSKVDVLQFGKNDYFVDVYKMKLKK